MSKRACNPSPPIAGDESALREVLTNLIFNAVDAMPTGGNITLETATEGERVLLRVRDTGTGMTEEVRRRCLEPFFSTKGENGTGLGLSMVYGIIERHRGRIEVESAPGAGPRLPFGCRCRARVRSRSNRRLARGGSRTPCSTSSSSMTKCGVREVISAYLRSDGHDVTTASSGLGRPRAVSSASV